MQSSLISAPLYIVAVRRFQKGIDNLLLILEVKILESLFELLSTLDNSFALLVKETL